MVPQACNFPWGLSPETVNYTMTNARFSYIWANTPNREAMLLHYSIATICKISYRQHIAVGWLYSSIILIFLAGLQYVDGAWKYFVNHGHGRWIDASHNVLEMFSNGKDLGTCTKLYKDNGEQFNLKRLNCEQTTAWAVCRISE